MEEEAQNNDLTRFERFKRWAKRNLGGISVVAISVTGTITTIVIGMRTVVKNGASATSKFAKFLGKVGEKAGPVLGAILNLAAGRLKLGAKAVSFLSENLCTYNQVQKLLRQQRNSPPPPPPTTMLQT